eukprot:872426-Pelagomonas_calceolata.AAC.1
MGSPPSCNSMLELAGWRILLLPPLALWPSWAAPPPYVDMATSLQELPCYEYLAPNYKVTYGSVSGSPVKYTGHTSHWSGKAHFAFKSIIESIPNFSASVLSCITFETNVLHNADSCQNLEVGQAWWLGAMPLWGGETAPRVVKGRKHILQQQARLRAQGGGLPIQTFSQFKHEQYRCVHIP